MTITIDGPAAAGKTTLAKALSERLGHIYLNSGAIYRALALLDTEEPGSERMPDLRFRPDGRILVDGRDRTDDLYSRENAMKASLMSQRAGVRKKVNRCLLALAKKHKDFIAEGRDMGTAVFPEADIKVYLTAELETRVWRRFRQHPELSYNTVLEDLTRRDEQDSTRECSPLRCADNAIVIDNTHLTVEQTVKAILSSKMTTEDLLRMARILLYAGK